MFHGKMLRSSCIANLKKGSRNSCSSIWSAFEHVEGSSARGKSEGDDATPTRPPAGAARPLSEQILVAMSRYL
ncbi:unnamed protein product [Nesidiocoris tenuis]|uniref:Uncharacterized protein n=1 Tax=Nesidiocoris tenuis TaxID=355587 RepID=A0A6H5GWF9_9HEMI|nr:unnamed protein product [Nesidiocoris tenuis]CAB0007175.1 unnamed protein product [Nesidiocoris tenuis]